MKIKEKLKLNKSTQNLTFFNKNLTLLLKITIL